MKWSTASKRRLSERRNRIYREIDPISGGTGRGLREAIRPVPQKVNVARRAARIVIKRTLVREEPHSDHHESMIARAIQTPQTFSR